MAMMKKKSSLKKSPKITQQFEVNNGNKHIKNIALIKLLAFILYVTLADTLFETGIRLEVWLLLERMNI